MNEPRDAHFRARATLRPGVRPPPRPRSPIAVTDYETGEPLVLRNVPALVALEPLAAPTGRRATRRLHDDATGGVARDPFANVLALGLSTASGRTGPPPPGRAADGGGTTTSTTSLADPASGAPRGRGIDPAVLAELSALRQTQAAAIEKLRAREAARDVTRRAALAAEQLPSRRQGLVATHADERAAAAKDIDALRLEHEVALLQRARTLGALPLPAV